MYRPRVQGMVVGQMLDIQNGDPTLHNVHVYQQGRTLFNQAQVPGSPRFAKPLGAPETIVRLKCDVHPWMVGYVWVGSNR